MNLSKCEALRKCTDHPSLKPVLFTSYQEGLSEEIDGKKKSIMNLYLSNWTQNSSIKEVPSSTDISKPPFTYPLGLPATPMVH